jgi:uncharacterized membrane protein
MAEALKGDEAERRERFRELLEELRTVLPGVQVLFAFLLTAPFSQRFQELDNLGRDAYAVALVSAGVSTVLFLTPTAYHRIAPRQDRAHRLLVAVRLAVAGMVSLLVAISAALFVVARFIYGTAEGVAVVVVVLGGALVLWFLLPLRRRLVDAGEPAGSEAAKRR